MGLTRAVSARAAGSVQVHHGLERLQRQSQTKWPVNIKLAKTVPVLCVLAACFAVAHAEGSLSSWVQAIFHREAAKALDGASLMCGVLGLEV